MDIRRREILNWKWRQKRNPRQGLKNDELESIFKRRMAQIERNQYLYTFSLGSFLEAPYKNI